MRKERLAMTPFIELKQITKRFAGVTALKDVNLSVYPGEVHAWWERTERENPL